MSGHSERNQPRRGDSTPEGGPSENTGRKGRKRRTPRGRNARSATNSKTSKTTRSKTSKTSKTSKSSLKSHKKNSGRGKKPEEATYLVYTEDAIPPEIKGFNKTYYDLPSAVLERLAAKKNYGLDQNDIDRHMAHFWTICKFLMRDGWTSKERKYQYFRPSPPPRPFAKPEQISIATNLLLNPDKPMKKLFKNQRHAGKGGFGDVHVMRDLTSKKKKRDVAVKRYATNSGTIQLLTIRLLHTEKTKTNNLTEIYFLSTCKHENICSFHTAFYLEEGENPFHKEKKKKGKEESSTPPTVTHEVWISVEYMEGGTLGEAAKSGSLSEEHVAFTGGEALKYLHGRQFVHRDLKSANVMMSVKGEVKLNFSEGPRVKMLGSPFWIPPEMVWAHPHSYPADVWSMGVCLLELLLTHPPHRSSSVRCMFLAATTGITDQIPRSISPEGRDFLTKALTVDYRNRESVDNLLAHQWVKRPNLRKGIVDVLRQIFLTHAMAQIGL